MRISPSTVMGTIRALLVNSARHPHPEVPKRTIEFFKNFLRSGDLCFDIGAHVGSKTELFRTIGARVICVEPQQNCVEVLKGKYGRDKDVIIIDKGCASKEGTLRLSVCGTADTISTFSEKWKTGRFKAFTWNTAMDVEVTTLDNLIRSFGVPRFCKIDVEGYEREVLEGLSTRLPYVSFEFTREFLGEARLCMQYLASLGPVEFNYAQGEEPRLVMRKWCNATTALQHIEQNLNDDLWGDLYARFPDSPYA